ncbi:hypothetical protein Dimus_015715, partial [Dionaea muscipula]
PTAHSIRLPPTRFSFSRNQVQSFHFPKPNPYFLVPTALSLSAAQPLPLSLIYREIRDGVSLSVSSIGDGESLSFHPNGESATGEELVVKKLGCYCFLHQASNITGVTFKRLIGVHIYPG